MRGVVEVAVHEGADLALDERQQPRRAHHAAAEDDPLRREHADHGDEPEREVAGLELPDRVVAGQLSGGASPARLDRETRRQPFPAIAVVGTDALEWIGLAVVRDPHVPELGVHEPVEKLPARHPSAADPGADGDVAEGVEPLGGTPEVLAEGRRVHVGVEDDGTEAAAGSPGRRRCGPSPASASS